MYEVNFEINNSIIETDIKVDNSHISADLVLDVHPSKTSELVNDSNFVTSDEVEEIISSIPTSTDWGNITGNIENQNDLKTALSRKADNLWYDYEQNLLYLTCGDEIISDGIEISGGGEPAYMKDLNNMVTIIDADEAEITGSNISVSKMEEQGYVAISAGYKDRIIGYVYDDKTEHVYILSTTLYGFKIPQSASYEFESATSRYKITFGNEKWLIVRGQYYQYFTSLAYNSKLTNESGSEYVKMALPICCYNYYGDNGTTLNNITGSITINFGENLKYLKLKSTNITLPTDELTWNFLFGLDNLGDIAQHFAGYDSLTETITIPSSTSLKLCSLSGSSNGQKNVLGLIKTGSKIVFDLSGATATGTATLLPYQASYVPAVPTVKDLKIKLPSTYTTVDITYRRYNAQFGLDFNSEALKFMADNAPSVTSATLKLGWNNAGFLTYTTEGQEILSTFTSKGWTVTGI